MKVSRVLGGLLLLFVLTHGFEEVSVTCTEYWLRVRLKRGAILENLQPQLRELYLGTGCPVSTEMHSYFEFVYPVTDCGIRKYDRMWGILIESSVTYSPTSSTIQAYYPIYCFIERNLSFIFARTSYWSSLFIQSVAMPVRESNSTSAPMEDVGICPSVSYGNTLRFVGLCHFLNTVLK